MARLIQIINHIDEIDYFIYLIYLIRYKINKCLKKPACQWKRDKSACINDTHKQRCKRVSNCTSSRSHTWGPARVLDDIWDGHLF